MADHAWRPLGELLIERGLIDPYELEYWLKQQTLTGMLLGELLVMNRIISPVEVAATLAVQRGADGVAGGIHDGPRQLGRILVEKEILTDSGLQRALLAQRRKGGSLGEILVERGYVTKAQLDDALAEQRGHGVGPSVREDPQAQPSEFEPDERYEVHAPDRAAMAVYVSESFLDATDYAFELIEREEPYVLEITRVASGAREQVWSYSREASEQFRAETAYSREPKTSAA